MSSHDVLTPEQRRRCMSAIRGKDTKPEVKLRKALWALGLRYRIGHNLPGKPDIVFVRERTAIFVDGCFWHKCPEHFQAPKTNPDFWEKKIGRNVERDKEVNELLRANGWGVLRIWEHEIKKGFESTVQKVIAFLDRAQ